MAIAPGELVGAGEHAEHRDADRLPRPAQHEVRAALRRRDPITAPTHCRHQPGGDGRLADARMRPGDDEARPERTHQYSMPFLPLIPRSYACLTFRISVTVSASAT